MLISLILGSNYREVIRLVSYFTMFVTPLYRGFLIIIKRAIIPNSDLPQLLIYILEYMDCCLGKTL